MIETNVSTRDVFIRFNAEKLLSLIALIAGSTNMRLVSLNTSLKIPLMLVIADDQLYR